MVRISVSTVTFQTVGVPKSFVAEMMSLECLPFAIDVVEFGHICREPSGRSQC